jgi:vacuolar-type H+-ATPase catalytic subunit A/Vma1
LEKAKNIRRFFTAQNAFDVVDTFTPLERQFEMMRGLLNSVVP